MNQLSMFDSPETSKEIQNLDNTRFLNIVKDCKAANMRLSDIFDSSVYDELCAVTYVSSPVFFSKIVKDFKKVKLVLGIPDGDFLSNFATRLHKLMNMEKRLEFWNKLNPDVKEKIQNDSICVRFGALPVSIHSKLYLLRNSEKDNKRVILGSANLTENAFLDGRQFEELMIFDDPALYDIYLKRFDEIYGHTVDYIPDTCRKHAPRDIIFTGDAETLANVLVEELEKNKARIVITEEQMAEIKSLSTDIVYQKEEVDRTKSVIELVTRKKSNSFIPKTGAELKKIFTNIKTQVCKISKEASNDNRSFYKYLPGHNTVLVCDRENQEIFKPFSGPASMDDIKRNLLAINKFIEAYRLFTIRPTLLNQSKVFEIILYSFIAPFIWKIREDYVLEKGRESVRADIPIFLFVAGRTKSGKSTALEFIGMLLGSRAPYYVPYKAVEKNLLDCFYTENICPALIDEIHPNFFKSAAQTKGEALIKHLSNDLSGQHPVLIGTTNAQDFSVPGQIHRRVYYIQIDRTFNINRYRGECNEYFMDVTSKIDESLFKDFLYRVTERIKDGIPIYDPKDFLYIARAIFKDYYQECGLELPEWFPERPFSDLDERGRSIWREIYNQYGKKAFKKRGDGTIFVDTSLFCSNELQKSRLLNFLDTSCIKEDSQILCLNTSEFFDFIGVEQRGILYKINRFLKPD